MDMDRKPRAGRNVLMVCFLAACIFFGIAGNLPAASVRDFPFRAAIVKGGGGSLARVEVPQAVISRSDTLLSGCRIFDNNGEEVPFRIYLPPFQPRGVIPWDIVDVRRTGGSDIYMLRRPLGDVPVTGIEIIPESGGFCSHVEVYAGFIPDAWQLLAKGRISDLRPAYDIYSTHIDLPGTRSTELKVVIRPAGDVPDVSPCLPAVSGEGEALPYAGRRAAVLRFRSTQAEPGGRRRVFAESVFRDFRTGQDARGDTIVDLGRPDLPVRQVVIRTGVSCFSREVELLTARKDEDGSYVRRASGVICSIPGLGISSDTIDAEIGNAGFMRIRIINHGSPPIRVKEVCLRWSRIYLIFRPEKGKVYELLYGAPDVPPAQYENTAALSGIDRDPDEAAAWKVEAAGENPAFRPGVFLGGEFRTFLMIGTIFLVGYICGSLVVLVRRYLPR